MSINFTDKLDEAIAELDREIKNKEKSKNSARATKAWATSEKLQEKMTPQTRKKYGINQPFSDSVTIPIETEEKLGWKSTNAPWRSKKLTGAQLNLLEQLDYTGPIPSSRGEASDIISKIINEAEISEDRKKVATRLFAMRLEEFDTRESIMTIDESSDYDFEILDKESQFEKAKLERQLLREAME